MPPENAEVHPHRAVPAEPGSPAVWPWQGTSGPNCIQTFLLDQKGYGRFHKAPKYKNNSLKKFKSRSD